MVDYVGQQFGNYQVLRKLGQGAFAEVYLGEHQYLEIPAAIKVLHARLGPETHEQFRREARTIAHLQHPHFVRVLEFGIQDQAPYLVLEFAPGGTLRTQHPKGTQLPLEQIVTYVKHLAPALDYAHQHGVIHRDVKPENMLLNTQHEVVLSDFGIAVVHQTLAPLSTQQPAGTPLYMAPEQIQGKPCPASDQYALAVVVYEWLCGEPPFRGSLFEVYSQHLHQPPPGFGSRVPHLPPLVEDAVLGALAKDPRQRFSSVQDFATVLEEACDATQPLVARVLAEQEEPERHAPPVTLSAPMAALRGREGDHSSETTHPQLMTSQQTGDEQELVQPVTGPPGARSSSDLKRAKPSVAQRNRERLLRKVHAYWIAGVLEHSLHGAALITLGLQEQPDAVATPWQLVLHHLTGDPQPLPAGTCITEVYDAADEELLILGAPGSGKTTLLLELARDLLERAEQDEQQPLPVVFNLSSWASKQQPLADWLVEELNRTYQVPRMLGQTWVDADHILPLLDGLDEVAPRERTPCIETINAYWQEHGVLPFVVCSRSADYLAQTARVRLGSAVMVQPLTAQQVDDYLAGGGEPLRALRVALQRDAALRELTTSPLMLSILTLTYQGVSVEELLRRDSVTDLQRQVFAHYVQRMLWQRGAEMRYTPEQTTRWLSQLACQMKRQSQTIFYLEQMQPTWLSDNRMLRVFDWWSVRLPGMIIGILVTLVITTFLPSFSDSVTSILLGGLLGGILSEGGTPQGPAANGRKVRSIPWQQFIQRLLVGILVGLGMGLSRGLPYPPQHELHDELITGLSFGLSFVLCSILLQVFLVKSNTAQSLSQTLSRVGRTKWQRLIKSTALQNGLLAWLFVGLSWGLSKALSLGLSEELKGLVDTSALSFGLSVGLRDGLLVGLSFGLSSGLLSLLLIGKSMMVQLTDRLIWSWTSLGRSLRWSQQIRAALQIVALVGLGFGLSSALDVVLQQGPAEGLRFWLGFFPRGGLLHSDLGSTLSLAVGFGLSYWLLIGLLQGVSREIIGDQQRIAPNQGIHRSAFNGLVLGCIGAMISGLSFGLNWEVYVWAGYALPIDRLGLGLIVGLSAGLLVGLFYGGLASFRHYVLRSLLWRTGAVPWRYVPFLDYAAEHILLGKVGGGYIFVHRLLQEYFASLESTPPFDESSAQTQPAQPVS